MKNLNKYQKIAIGLILLILSVPMLAYFGGMTISLFEMIYDFGLPEVISNIGGRFISSITN